jgi:hypothetical protein
MMKILLYVIITMSTGGTPQVTTYEMTNLDVCLAAVSTAQVGVPSGGDAETSVTMFCAGPLVEATDWHTLRQKSKLEVL